MYGVIVEWNISHEKKNWQRPRLHFPSPTVRPPSVACITPDRQTFDIKAVCAAGEECEQCVC